MRKLLISFVTLTGCVSAGRLPASYLGETAPALAPGHVSVTAAAGGAASPFGVGGGAGVRVRVGIGNDQEMGVEVAAMEANVPAKVCLVADCSPEENTDQMVVSYSALASWKFGGPHAALIASVGAAQHHNAGGDPEGDYEGTSADGALAVVLSRPLSSVVDVYGGGRLAIGIPVSVTNDAATTAGSLSGTVGLSEASSDNVHLFAEMGGLAIVDGDSFPVLAIQAVVGVRVSL
jgi:hypothetical protein